MHWILIFVAISSNLKSQLNKNVKKKLIIKNLSIKYFDGLKFSKERRAE